ncbi:FAD:protein FMN transferase [candidate division KSB1 bacterium]|nr:FAD:protein FMN transferase [candidate division KSB1 bacterium]
MIRKYIFLSTLLLIFCVCGGQDSLQPIVKTKFLMDTLVEISVYDQDISEEEVTALIDAAFIEIAYLDSLYNNYNEFSYVTYINNNAYKTAVPLDTGLVNLLTTSIHVSELSNGAFDITIAPVLDAWNFGGDVPNVPEESAIRSALSRTGYNFLEIKNNKVKFLKKDMKIDLGGIAKGYVVDRAMSSLVKNGITDAMINAGGDIRTICGPMTENKRSVWIRHPRKREKLFGRFQMDTGSVATSGDYERFFISDSVRYHHIVDPKTGYPADKCVSVTIVSENLMVADAFATAVFVLGPDAGLGFIERLPEIEGIIIYEKNDSLVYKVSSGLVDKFLVN